MWKGSGAEGRLDVIFPVLHGTYGEDGTLQGFLDLAGVPYVGAGTAASAIGMDKALMKSLFREAGLPVVANLVIPRLEWEHRVTETLARVEDTLAYPVFVKPANLGSSVGINKVKQSDELASALDEAFCYDHKAIVEQGVDAREIEVSVLGNDEPEASLPGEIVPGGEFYDYRAKYIDDTSELFIPAPLDEETTTRARELAVAAFRALGHGGDGSRRFFARSPKRQIVPERVEYDSRIYIHQHVPQAMGSERSSHDQVGGSFDSTCD